MSSQSSSSSNNGSQTSSSGIVYTLLFFASHISSMSRVLKMIEKTMTLKILLEVWLQKIGSHLNISIPKALLISLTTGLSKLTGPKMYGDFTPVIIEITCTFPSNSGRILAPQNT